MSSVGKELHPAAEKGEFAVPRQYAPLTEPCFYILLALRKERHGYDIIQWTQTVTGGELRLQGGTLYNSLARLEHDGVIRITHEDDRRKYYRITELGEKVLRAECSRLERIYKNSQDKIWKCGRALKSSKAAKAAEK